MSAENILEHIRLKMKDFLRGGIYIIHFDCHLMKGYNDR